VNSHVPWIRTRRSFTVAVAAVSSDSAGAPQQRERHPQQIPHREVHELHREWGT
jgi:hypothetical protein